MFLPLLIAVVAMFSFAAAAIILSLEENKLKSALFEKDIINSMINNLEEGICLINNNNRITAINKKARQLLNLQKDNPSLTDILSSLPNTYNFADKINKTLLLKEKIEERNISIGNKLLNITITPIESINKPQLGALFLIHDAAKDMEISKMKEDFTSIIVHELRTPLTSIKASSEMLNREGNLTDDERKRLITIISEQTAKILDEVSQILDAARLDNGLFTIHKTNGDLKKVLESTVISYQTLAQSKFIKLIVNIDPGLSQIAFDESYIKRVLNNLLTNSFKFTPSGGTITVHTWATLDKVFVSVSDTGCGIDLEKQHLIFTKFAQIKNPSAAVGTGLGLYVSKGIIEAHGGTISLESDPGKGTTVTFTLPSDNPTQTLPTSFPAYQSPLVSLKHID